MSVEKLLDYFKEDNDRRFSEVGDRLKNIEEKIDTLLQFKWQIIGGSVLISVLFTIGFQILGVYLKTSN